MGPDQKPVVVVKAPLAKIIEIPITSLSIRTESIELIVWLLRHIFSHESRYIFVHSYDNDDDYDDDAFNADIFMTDLFFIEVLRSLQTHTRRASKDENTLQNRQLINKYCERFCHLYSYQRIAIPGIASNLEA